MPTYEYACEKCGERFEVNQPITAAPLTVHADCGGKLTKVFGSVGISFKGSGFYRTDNPSRRSSSGSGDSSSKSGSSSSSSTDSKSTSNTSTSDSKSTPKTSE